MIISARSLAKPDAASALHAELHSNKIDICFVSGTWLNNRIPSHLVCPNGYILLRKDRAGTSNGGGVAVICRSDWQVKRLFSSDFFECVWSVITTPNSKYYVAAVYHPPDPVYAVYAVYPVYQHWRSVLHAWSHFHPGWHSYSYNWGAHCMEVSEYIKAYCSGSRWTSVLDLEGLRLSTSPTITKVFNSSLKKQLVPCFWKLANITPIPKETPFETCNQLRPISLTNVIMRLFERVVVKQELSPVLKSAIGPDEFAYKEGCNALLICHHHWLKWLDRTTDFARGFSFDLGKAFDSVPHAIVCNKLMSLNINTHVINWTVSFLSNRKQRAVVDGFVTEFASITRGVP